MSFFFTAHIARLPTRGPPPAASPSLRREARASDLMVAANHPPWNLSVLVVDDSRDGADSLTDLLTVYGYDARPAYTPSAALVTAPADVVILELRLPEMSGWELVRQMKERSAEKPPIFIAVTTCGQERDRQKSREAGIGLHLVKPVDPGVLNGVLKRFARALAPC